MKLTKSQLKQLIKEELQNVLQEQDPCGQKPPLPKNWQSIKKGQPGWNERMAYRKWYICKKKGGKGAPAAQQEQDQDPMQTQVHNLMLDAKRKMLTKYPKLSAGVTCRIVQSKCVGLIMRVDLPVSRFQKAG